MRSGYLQRRMAMAMCSSLSLPRTRMAPYTNGGRQTRTAYSLCTLGQVWPLCNWHLLTSIGCLKRQLQVPVMAPAGDGNKKDSITTVTDSIDKYHNKGMSRGSNKEDLWSQDATDFWAAWSVGMAAINDISDFESKPLYCTHDKKPAAHAKVGVPAKLPPAGAWATAMQQLHWCWLHSCEG